MTVTRRAFLGLGAGGAVAAFASRWPALAATGEPFLHGVASGDPLADRVVIWTRVTPSPDAAPGSGVGGAVEVRWEVATDPAFGNIAAAGGLTTNADHDHTVKVDVARLAADTDHWYRFHALDATSPSGRTRTATAVGAPLDALRLGVATCADYETGFFAAYRHLAERDDLDAVVHLGDYIYESATLAIYRAETGRSNVPPHECVTLADYRLRHGTVRLDPDLQALHAAHPMIVVWDDHEVVNDTWREGAGALGHDPTTQGPFAARAAAGRQAWREWIPARQVDPADPEVVYRSFRFGDLVELWMLDERRYRDQQPDAALLIIGSADPTINDPERTMLGAAQRRWLFDGLTSSTAAWKAVGNPVPLFPFGVLPALPAVTSILQAVVDVLGAAALPIYNYDDWNAYRAEQAALIGLIHDTPVADVVVLTGDYHETFAADLPTRPDDYLLDGNSAAVELVVPAISSPSTPDNLRLVGATALSAQLADVGYEALVAGNPWIRYHDGFANGFGVVEFTAERMHADFWFLDDRTDPTSGARVGASFEARRGLPRLAPASSPLPPRPRRSAPVPASSAPSGSSPAPASSAPEAADESEPTGALPATGARWPWAAAAAAGAAGLAMRTAASATPHEERD